MTDKKCKHCGKPMAELPYGSGKRWEHKVRIAGVWVSGGIFCQTTTAAPRTKKKR